MRVFWNGAEVLSDDKYRDLDSDRFAARSTSRDGWNRLTVKVCGDEHAPMLSLRLADADGAPDEHLEVDPDPAHSTRRGGGRASRAQGRAAAARRDDRGARPERSSASPKCDDPAALEAYARYLVRTGSDDPTEHRARELARRAADKAPTIARLLLAGELAESRNQRAIWIDKAEALAAARRTSREERDRRAPRARRPRARRRELARRDPVLRPGPRARPRQRAGDARARRALRRGRPARDRARARSSARSRAGRAAWRSSARRSAALRDDGPRRPRPTRWPSATRAPLRRPGVPRGRASSSRSRGATRRAAARWIERLIATNPDSAGALADGGAGVDAPRRAAARHRDVQGARSTSRPRTPTRCASSPTLYALDGQHDEQLRLLKRVLELMPQEKDVREYVAHIEPGEPRPDEQYARPSQRVPRAARAPANGAARRIARRPAGDDGLSQSQCLNCS